eukprot:m.26565 g.26565  ORF g.26565 m.26565 type:complete len:54 (+) comp4324_c0_seq1:1820-1981(+)
MLAHASDRLSLRRYLHHVCHHRKVEKVLPQVARVVQPTEMRLDPSWTASDTRH